MASRDARGSGEAGWDDLRLCLAVHRHGTVSGAAAALGVSHSTVLRRIAAFEQRLGVVIFRRKANGYEANAAGERLIEAAEAVEASISEAVREVAGTDAAMRGTIRLSLPEAASSLIMRVVAEFQARYPDVSVALDVAQTASSMTTGEAHLAVVLTGEAPLGQLGVPIGPVGFAAYAVEAVARAREPAWIGLDRPLSNVPVSRFDRSLSARFRVVSRCATIGLLRNAILAGLGAGLLPCAVGDSEPTLRRVGPVLTNDGQTLWLLHRREMRENVRIKTLYHVLRRGLSARRALIAGEEPFAPAMPLRQLTAAGPLMHED